VLLQNLHCFLNKKICYKILKHERKQCLKEKECLFEIFGSIENNFVPSSFAPLASLGVKNAGGEPSLPVV
jgi:hypothetical protein